MMQLHCSIIFTDWSTVNVVRIELFESGNIVRLIPDCGHA